MRKTNVLYLIGSWDTHIHRETHRDKERETHTHKQTNRYTQRETQKDTNTHRDTHRDTYKELLQKFNLPFATHMNLNKLLLLKHSNIVPTQFI